MPTYDYKCEVCGHAFERFHSMTAQPIRKCPQCGKSRVRRLIGTGAGLIFKGSGFYATDYRSEAYKSAAKNDGGADKAAATAKSEGSTTASATQAAGGSTGKTESKPQPKSSPSSKAADSK
jgi:putative FmdB family regulatory protein